MASGTSPAWNSLTDALGCKLALLLTATRLLCSVTRFEACCKDDYIDSSSGGLPERLAFLVLAQRTVPIAAACMMQLGVVGSSACVGPVTEARAKWSRQVMEGAAPAARELQVSSACRMESLPQACQHSPGLQQLAARSKLGLTAAAV